MKELTIEEKAKRYDGALERAKEQSSKCCLDKIVLEDIFPELKESEDERMKKLCISVVKQFAAVCRKEDKYLPEVEKCIAWLEKQGEQKPADKVEPKKEDTSELTPFEAELFSMMSDAWQGYQLGEEVNIVEIVKEHSSELLERANEQSHAWSEEDEQIFNVMKSELEKYIMLKQYGTPLSVYDIEWFKSLKDRVQPQPKQKWKQENTDDLTDFENAMMHIGDSFFGQHAGLDPNNTNAIKEQANLLLRLIPSKEWREEDDIIAHDIDYALRGQIIYPISKLQSMSIWIDNLKYRVQPQNLIVIDEELAQAKKDAYNDALNKIEYHNGEPTFDDGWSAAIWYLKKRYAQPQTTWKPSDEQMGVIEAVINNRSFQRRHLNSLYNDLKKLKG